MSGGGEGSSGAKQAAQSQAFIARDLFSSTEPGRIASLDQALNLLRGGGRTGTIPPILKNILSGAQQGTDNTVAATVDANAKLGNEAFTPGMVSNIRTAGGQAAEGARDAYVRQSLEKTPDLAIQPVQLATQGLQGLVNRGAQQQVAKQQKENAIITGSASAAGTVVAAAVAAYII